jgi:hypothetical protein
MMQNSRTKVISNLQEEPVAQLEPEGGVEAVGGVEVGAEGPRPDQIKTMILQLNQARKIRTTKMKMRTTVTHLRQQGTWFCNI